MKGLLLGLLLLVPVAAQAQGHYGVHKSYQESRDDWHDVQRVENLLRDHDFAARRRDVFRLRSLESELHYLLSSEVRETRREMRGDLKDARRDWYPRDEYRDARIEARTLERLRSLRYRAESLRGRMDAWGLRGKREVIVELLDLSRAELRQDRFEQPRRWAEGRRGRW